MRVYNRAIGSESWNTLEEYMAGLSSVWYGTGTESAQDYRWLAGHWLSGLTPPPAGVMLYQDWFGVGVGGEFETAAVPKRVPEYLEEYDVPSVYTDTYAVMPMAGPGLALCAVACVVAGTLIGIALAECMNTPPPDGCQGIPGAAYYICLVDCAITNGCEGVVSGVSCLLCAICTICRIPRPVARKVCKKLWDDFLKKFRPEPKPRPSQPKTETYPIPKAVITWVS